MWAQRLLKQHKDQLELKCQAEKCFGSNGKILAEELV